LVNYAKTLPELPLHKVQVGTGAKVARQAGQTTALELLKIAAEHVCYACGGSVQRDAKNWLQCGRGCKGGAFYQNDGSGVVYRMVDGLRYHHLKMAILAIDTCTQGLPLIEFTAYGKSAISMKCIKCKASLSRSFINDGVNFDLEGTPSNAYGAGHHGLTFD